jgi:multidrug efflux pump subunit AcrB
MSTKAEQKQQDQADAIARLRGNFPAGGTVHTVIRHVTSSGMGRSISVLATDGAEIWDVSYLVARALGWKLDQTHGGVKVAGAGMDMTFHLVYTLSQTLYGAHEGYALNRRNI